MSIAQLIQNYTPQPHQFDEMLHSNAIREPYTKLVQTINENSIESLQLKDKLAGELFMNQGITFTVYSDNAGIERIFPFDILPRIITAAEWAHVEKGIE
jgi:uncharacterized circularly permuted ATP-grasp superfamily protein